jgi:two-component system nitrate/nitrite response regulator NarP
LELPRTSALDDSALGTLCQRVLEHMNLGVIACDDALTVLAATPTAQRLLAELASDSPSVMGARVPEPVLAAALDCLARADEDGGRRRIVPLRVESPDGEKVMYVAAKRVAGLLPATVAIRIHQERLSDAELFESLARKFDLNARDRRVLVLLRQGLKNGAIAESLGLTVGTVKVYVHDLFEKLGVHSRGELLAVLDRFRKGR